MSRGSRRNTGDGPNEGEARAEVEGVPVAPVSVTERISSLDFIRGIAVMGILVANIIAFGQPSVAYFVPSAFLVDAGDPGGWQWIAQFVLIDSKMRGLFTLLFGAGMYLFMERAWAKGATRAFFAGHPDLEGTRWAKTGHPCLIPGSMYSGAAILLPEPGAQHSGCSVNHGSGRVMARGHPKRTPSPLQAQIDS